MALKRYPHSSIYGSSLLNGLSNLFNKSSNLEIFERLFIAPLPTTPLMRSDAFPCHAITIDSVTADPFSMVLVRKSRYL